MRSGGEGTGKYTTAMFRRSRVVRRGVLAVLLAVAAGAPAATPGHAQAAIDLPVIAVVLAPEHERYRTRIEAAARSAAVSYRQWLGPHRAAIIQLDDRSAGASSIDGATRITLDLPWLSAAPTMDIESRVVFGLARAWWPGWAQQPATRPIVDGLAWYLQSRVIPEMFDLLYQRPAYNADAAAFFGGAVPWAFPSLTSGRWTAGLGRAEFLGSGRAPDWPRQVRRLPPDADPLTPHAALAFGTLERLVGWPALEGALAALAPKASAGVMTATDIERTLSASVGQPLSWFIAPAWDRDRQFDYRLGAVSAGPCGRPSCVRTEVTVLNRGDAAFTGTSRSPVGDYGAGDALELLVTFADGQQSSVRWDGRAASKVFTFESTVPPRTVELDPAGALLLDRSDLDDAWRAAPNTDVPLAKWIAWWLIWLQDAAISYGGLI